MDANSECAPAFYFFGFENAQGNNSFCSILAQNTAETSQPQAQLADDWRAIDMVIPQGFQRLWEMFGSARA